MIQNEAGSSSETGTITFMPRKPAVTVAGRNMTVATVSTFMTSLVRCAVRVIRMSNDPRTASRVDSIDRSAPSKWSETGTNTCESAEAMPRAKSGPSIALNTARCAASSRRRRPTRRRLETSASNRSPVPVRERPGVDLVELVLESIDGLVIARDDPLQDRRDELRRVELPDRCVGGDPLVHLLDEGEGLGMHRDHDVRAAEDVEPADLLRPCGVRFGGHAQVEVLAMQLDMRPVRPLSQGPLGLGVEPEALDHGLEMLCLEVALDVDPQELPARHPGLHRLPEGQILVRPVGIEQPDPQARSRSVARMSPSPLSVDMGSYRWWPGVRGNPRRRTAAREVDTVSFATGGLQPRRTRRGIESARPMAGRSACVAGVD